MPTYLQTIDFDLDDYFCRHGFGDGDSVAHEVAKEHAEFAAEIVTEALRIAGFPTLNAKYENVYDMHNSHRISIYEMGEDIGVEADAVQFCFKNLNEKWAPHAEELKEALSNASTMFDEGVMRNIQVTQVTRLTIEEIAEKRGLTEATLLQMAFDYLEERGGMMDFQIYMAVDRRDPDTTTIIDVRNK